MWIVEVETGWNSRQQKQFEQYDEAIIYRNQMIKLLKPGTFVSLSKTFKTK